MSDEIKIPPGSSVTLKLRRKRSRRPGSPSEASSSAAAPGGAIVVEDEATRYLRRRKKIAGVRFFDLGTRLRSVPASTVFNGLRQREPFSAESPAPCEGCFSEYVDILLEAAGTYSETPPSEPAKMFLSNAERVTLERALLGSRADVVEGLPRDLVDPLGVSEANGSARVVSNCLEIYYNAGNSFAEPLLFDVYKQQPTRFVDPEIAPTPLYTDYTRERYDIRAKVEIDELETREEEDDDASERWNPRNVETGAPFDAIEIPEQTVTGHLLIGSFPQRFEPPLMELYLPATNVYYGFDTGDLARFKVTSEPRFSADRVSYQFAGDDNRVFLRPRTMGYRVHSSAASDNIDWRRWVGRLVFTYPRTPFHTDPHIGAGSEVDWRCAIERSPLAAFATKPGGFGLWSHLRLIDQLPAETLVGIIAQKSKVFYVWTADDTYKNAAGILFGFASNIAITGCDV